MQIVCDRLRAEQHSHGRLAVDKYGVQHSHERLAVDKYGVKHSHERLAVDKYGVQHSHERLAVGEYEHERREGVWACALSHWWSCHATQSLPPSSVGRATVT